MDIELGILGVGSIAEAIVTGLGPEYLEETPVLLSPRSRSRTAALTERFPSLGVATDNQDLVDRCRTILLCVRPQDARSILEELTFVDGQRVISVVAAVSRDQMQTWVQPAKVVARVIPLPAVAQRQGLTAVFPPDPSTRDLFERLGGSLGVEDESTLDAMSASTATIAAHLAYLATISKWLSERGMSEEEASRYVAATFAPLGELLRSAPTELAHLARGHATPGGLNEQFAKALRDAAVYDVVSRSLDQLEARTRG